jgi:pilus assembly protein CpaF
LWRRTTITWNFKEVFTFERTGVDANGKVKGTFRGTGVRPKILDRLRVSGINLPDSVFDETLAVNS